MADRFLFLMVVQPILKEGERSPGPLRQHVRDRRLGLFGVRGDSIDLHAVTGRQHQPLAHRRLPP